MIIGRYTGNIIAKFAIFLLLLSATAVAQTAQQPEKDKKEETASSKKTASRVLYGQASYYASKFEGRKTANGEIFRHSKLTAACNSLPLGTWIKVTNLRNGKSVTVKVNDRLHTRTKRLVDLTRSGAQKLGFIKSGLTRVKVEVLKKKPA